jgi:hypothetical protein
MDSRASKISYQVRHVRHYSGNNGLYLRRFYPEDLRKLINYFEIDTIVWRYRIHPPPELALTLLCARLSYPYRFIDLQNLFGRSETWLKLVFADTLDHMYLRYKKLLHWHPTLTYERMKHYADVLDRESDVDCVWGFIDGTFRPFCRPGVRQQEMYSGYKKLHGFKVQGVCTPDGLLVSCDGPYEGKVNDLTMVRKSGIEKRLREIFTNEAEPLALYGDQAYKSCTYIFGPYKDYEEDRLKARFNVVLSSIRISVEQIFGKNSNLFSMNQLRIGLRPGSMPVAAYWMVAALLTNCHTCLYGSQIATRFNCKPMSLEEYLQVEGM